MSNYEETNVSPLICTLVARSSASDDSSVCVCVQSRAADCVAFLRCQGNLVYFKWHLVYSSFLVDRFFAFLIFLLSVIRQA